MQHIYCPASYLGPEMPKKKGFILACMGNFIQGTKCVAERLSPRKGKKRRSDDEKENVCLDSHVLTLAHSIYRVLPSSIMDELEKANVV
jgi:hypothetical protein